MASGKPTASSPPRLPAYLANLYELKPVAEVPTNDEVKEIHAVIRAMEAISHIPALYDTGTAMELSQHLFNVQMKRCRTQYSCALFPGEVVYTPPELPAHIPNTLEPVTGFPSDDQIISARAAVKASESFSNTSMFDADLSMKLSQHLFNIQLARYIQDTAQTLSRTTSPLPSIQNPQPQNRSAQATEGVRTRNNPTLDSEMISALEGEPGVTTTSEVIQLSDSTSATNRVPEKEELERTESSQLLCDIKSTLESVNRVLVATQNSLAQGFNRHFGHHNGGLHPVINYEGRNPTAHGIPPFHKILYSNADTFDSKLLAQSLRFYGIGSGLIEEGNELRIKSGKESKAWSTLQGHVNPSGCHISQS